MEEINEETVKKVARIARLDISEEEVKKFVPQLKEILYAFSKLNEVETSDVKPSYHPIEIKNVVREDVPKKWKWNPLSNAKNKEDGYFKGPRAV